MNTDKCPLRYGDTISIRLPEQLRKLRKRRGYSQEEIATLLFIHRSTYSYYETGQTQPTLEILAALAQFYHVSLEYLLGLTENSTIDRYRNGRPE